MTETIDIKAAPVVQYMIKNRITLTTAESCTGGMVAQTITSVPGASAVFPGGIVAYSEEIKHRVLGVSSETLRRYTVYSAETASEMSMGAMKLFGTQAAVGITGLAGPDGGSPEKPVGTVYVSVRLGEQELVRDLELYKDNEDLNRDKIRRLTTGKAFDMLRELLKAEV